MGEVENKPLAIRYGLVGIVVKVQRLCFNYGR
jgi:hypothetical protein